MKYIQDDGLSYITSILTDCPIQWNNSSYHHSSIVGGGATTRTLHGKLEAYSRKRAGTDKKYANQLGSTWTAYQEQVEADAAILAYKNMIIQKNQEKDQKQQPKQTQLEQPRSVDDTNKPAHSTSTETGAAESSKTTTITRKRSYSVGNHGEDRVVYDSVSMGTGIKTGQQKHFSEQHKKNHVKKAQRRRSNSLNIVVPSSKRQYGKAVVSSSNHSQPKKKKKASLRHSNHHSYDSKNLHEVGSTLGDISATSTRRLLTDLILTLNMSFPDYDFGSAKPDDFYRYPNVRIPMKQINEKLFDFDCCSSSSSGNNNNFLYTLWKAIDNVIQINSCEVVSYQPNRTKRSGGNGEYTSSDDDPLAFLEQTFLSSSNSSNTSQSMKSSTASSNYLRSSSKTDLESIRSSAHGNDVLDYHPEDVSIIYDDDNNKGDPNPNLETVLWSLNYFFVNKTTKRILLFTCIETMRYTPPSSTMDDEDGVYTNDHYSYDHSDVVPLYLQRNDDSNFDDSRRRTTAVDKVRTNKMKSVDLLENLVKTRGRSVSDPCESTDQTDDDSFNENTDGNRYGNNMDEDDDSEDDNDDDGESDEEEEDDRYLGSSSGNSRLLHDDVGSENSSVAGSEDYDMDPESIVPGGIPIS